MGKSRTILYILIAGLATVVVLLSEYVVLDLSKKSADREARKKIWNGDFHKVISEERWNNAHTVADFVAPEYYVKQLWEFREKDAGLKDLWTPEVSSRAKDYFVDGYSESLAALLAESKLPTDEELRTTAAVIVDIQKSTGVTSFDQIPDSPNARLILAKIAKSPKVSELLNELDKINQWWMVRIENREPSPPTVAIATGSQFFADCWKRALQEKRAGEKKAKNRAK